MSDIAFDKCSLLSVFVESVLWGIFVSLYSITLFLLLQKKSKIGMHVPHLILVSIMFLLCTLHVGLSFSRNIDAFNSTYPIVYLQDISNWSFRFKNGVFFVMMFMGDLLIIFRSFMLWDKNYLVIILPSLLAMGTMATAGGALHAMSLASHTDPIFDGKVRSWIAATLALGLATRGISFLLVGFRVRQIHAVITSTVNRHVTVYTIMVVLIESGAAAFVTTLILLPMFMAKQTAHYIVWDALSPIMAMVFTTIIAGMTINLSNPGPSVPVSRPAWNNRYSVPSPITPSRAAKSKWNDYDEDADTPETTPSSPVLSRSGSMQNNPANQSAGTLNLAIVI